MPPEHLPVRRGEAPFVVAGIDLQEYSPPSRFLPLESMAGRKYSPFAHATATVKFKDREVYLSQLWNLLLKAIADEVISLDNAFYAVSDIVYGSRRGSAQSPFLRNIVESYSASPKKEEADVIRQDLLDALEEEGIQPHMITMVVPEMLKRRELSNNDIEVVCSGYSDRRRRIVGKILNKVAEMRRNNL